MSQDGKAEEKEGEERRNFLSLFFLDKYKYVVDFLQKVYLFSKILKLLIFVYI